MGGPSPLTQLDSAILFVAPPIAVDLLDWETPVAGSPFFSTTTPHSPFLARRKDQIQELPAVRIPTAEDRSRPAVGHLRRGSDFFAERGRTVPQRKENRPARETGHLHCERACFEQAPRPFRGWKFLCEN